LDLEKEDLDRVVAETNNVYKVKNAARPDAANKTFTLEDILRKVEDISRCH